MAATLAAPSETRRRSRTFHVAVIFCFFAGILFLLHSTLLNLPYFWDELGQFVPTALDLLRHGEWIPHSAVPNVHPPGVEAYLVLWYKLFGYSIAITRVAMLVLASVGLLLTFLLAIELSRQSPGAPAFWPPVLLLASPLFFMQSFLAQLDMPAMVATLLALFLFLNRRFGQAAIACTVLVLFKETGLVTPFILFLWLVWKRQWRSASYFIAPAVALAIWLAILHRATGYWLGDPGFAHYNVDFALDPIRVLLSFSRRIYYVFIADFRWIGTLLLLLAFGRLRRIFSTDAWRIVLFVSAANLVLVSVLGGAELERYLLPVLPVFYIAVAIAGAFFSRWWRLGAMAALMVGSAVSLLWNPPYPFPYENNWSMVDFVHLQQAAAEYAETNLGDETIATAWPYTAALRNPDDGYVHHRLHTLETGDFDFASLQRLDPAKFGVLIVYTRTWMPNHGVIAIPGVRSFLSRFYLWRPPVTPAECRELGLYPRASWSLRGQKITIYTRTEAVLRVSDHLNKQQGRTSANARLATLGLRAT